MYMGAAPGVSAPSIMRCDETKRRTRVRGVLSLCVVRCMLSYSMLCVYYMVVCIAVRIVCVCARY